MTLSVDLQAFMRAMEPGTMVCARVPAESGNLHTAVLIREAPERLDALTGKNDPELKLQIFGANVTAVALLARIGEQTYATWFNYYEPGGADAQTLGELAKLDRLPVVFYTDHAEEERLVTNSVRSVSKVVTELCQTAQPWSTDDFDTAREVASHQFPNPPALWQAYE